MSETLTPQESQKVIDTLNAEYRQVSDSIKKSGLVGTAASLLDVKRTEIQDLITSIMKKGGIITEDDYNKAYELVRKQKQDEINKLRKQQKRNLAIAAALLVVMGAALYFYKRKKN